VGFDGADHRWQWGQGSKHSCREVDRRALRSHRGFHPRSPGSHRCQQLFFKLQEQGLEE